MGMEGQLIRASFVDDAREVMLFLKIELVEAGLNAAE